MEALKDKVVIVTGASRGIGFATAEIFAQNGAKVVLTSQDKEELQHAVDHITAKGQQAIGIVGDVGNTQDVQRTIKEVLAKWGQIDILVNNAGTAVRKSLQETSEQEWNEMMSVNLKSIFLFSKLALSALIKRKGVIVNVSSIAGRIGRSLYTAYSASKFGIVGFSESLAQEVMPEGVRVYTVCPSGVNTEMHRKIYPEQDASKLMSPQVVANKIVELVLPSSSLPSGSVVDVVNKK